MSESFKLDEEHRLFQRDLREWCTNEIEPDMRECEKTGSFPFEPWKKIAARGFMGICFPEKYGGMGMDHLYFVLACEELSRVGLSLLANYGVQVTLGGYNILQFGTEAQKSKWLPKLISGELAGGTAITEPDCGSDVAAITTRADLVNHEWVINGTKTFISNVHPLPGFTCVLAVSGKTPKGEKEYSLIIVPNDTPGYERIVMHKFGLMVSPTCECYFENVHVPEENIIGQRGKGFWYINSMFDEEHIMIAAGGLGALQRILELCFDYANMRQAFGKPIWEQEAIQFRIADMAVDLDAARLLTYKAACLLDQPERGPASELNRAASMAKLFTVTKVWHWAVEGLEVFGGSGFTTDVEMSRFYRDVYVAVVGGGTPEIQRIIVGRCLSKRGVREIGV